MFLEMFYLGENYRILIFAVSGEKPVFVLLFKFQHFVLMRVAILRSMLEPKILNSL